MWDYGHFWWEVRDVPGWNGKGSGIGRGDGEGFGKHRSYVRSWEDDGLVCRGGLRKALWRVLKMRKSSVISDKGRSFLRDLRILFWTRASMPSMNAPSAAWWRI